ncbi:uroporphyrinogen-III synthase [Membranihabitans marinus]|uniref:uroporphyrinogen-III synthase n=1 Tax=Membranihabitans marinus TaxID=1227546 RepID=UPI001F289878|nr:uroporphyrinogen-III synthase [Membranihabitans marinus]
MKVFISRTIDDSSPIQEVIKKYNCTLVQQSLIDIGYIDILEIPRADWHFFYSKNGVNSYLRSGLHSVSHGVKYGAIGPGTALHMRNHGLPCDFTGSGTANTSLDSFLEICEPSEEVLFFRAQRSANSLCKLMKVYRHCTDVIAYNNRPITQRFDDIDIGLFTSSLNAKAYLSKNPMPRLSCVAIGQPTYDTLISEGIEVDKIHLSPATSDRGLATSLEEAIRNSLQ